MTAVAVRTALVSWTAPTTNSDGSALTDLVGYRIRFGNASNSYGQSVTINNASANQWVLPLTPGTWYFVVASLNAAGNESAYSMEVSKTIN